MKRLTLRMKLPLRCGWFGHNSKGLLYEQTGNPDKKVKIWKGYYCTRCGLIVDHTHYKKRDFSYSYF